MTVAVYPGSFDPVTNGHMDVIERAAGMFDKLIVGVLRNSAKNSLFTIEERVKMLKMLTEGMPNIEVKSLNGLTVDFARSEGAAVMVRGLRAVTDFEFELQLSQTNRVIAPELDTVFLTTNLKYSYLSSSIVKEIASYGGSIDEFLDPRVAVLVHNKYNCPEGK